MIEQGNGDWQLYPPRPSDLGLRALQDAEGGSSYRAIIESICGATDDSQDVELYNGNLGVSVGFVLDHQAPVGQVQWNNNIPSIYTNAGNVNAARWGSGTLISDNLFLTAGHLFDAVDANGWMMPRVNGTNNIIPPAEIARNMHVNFDYQRDSSGNLRPEQQYTITGLLEYRLGGLDYAIIRLAGNPGQRYGTGTISRVDAATNDMLCIIGHPAGVPKRVEAGPTIAIHNDEIRYSDIDTLGGNSGSGIWHAGQGTLVGVHTNGGCTNAGGYNLGVRIGRLLEVSPLLRNLPTSTKLAAASWGPNRVDVFALGNDLQMFHKALTGNTWYPSPTGWEPLGGAFSSPPAVTAWGANRLDIFAVGMDRALYHKAWSPAGWYPSIQGWEPLGGGFVSPPTAVAWGANRLDVFGIGTDGQMFHKAWDGARWWPSATGWQPLGGYFTSPPAVESWGQNRLDIFGIGGDGQMYHKAWSSAGWYPSETGWQALGGYFNSPPSVVSWGNERLDIFAIGGDSEMYHKAWSPAGWYPSETTWHPLGGLFTSAPTAVSWGANRLDIFGLGLNRSMYHKAWTGSGWLPFETGWTPLGGVFRGP